MARDFEVGSSESIVLGIGSLGWTGSTGLTYAVIASRESTGTNRALIGLGSGTTNRSTFSYRSTGNGLELAQGSTVSATVGTLANNAWNILAVTKAGGTTLARFHSCDMATGSWTHTSTGSGSANMSATPNTVYLGRTPANTNTHDGCMALAAVWKRELSDAEIELLYGGFRAWQSLAPDALWPLNQNDVSQPVFDWTGNGANQTSISGTSVATNRPYGWRWGGSIRRVSHVVSSGSSVTGAAGLTASGVLASLGSLSLVSSSALTASGVLVAQGRLSLVSSSALSASAILAAQGCLSLLGSSALSASAILAASGARAVTGQTALTSVATLVAAGLRGALGQSQLTASAFLSANASLLLGGASALTASASLAVTGARLLLAAVTLAASATVDVAGTSTPPVLGEASLTAAAFLQSGSDLYKLGKARLAAEAFVEAAPGLLLTSTAAFEAAAVLSSTASMFLAPSAVALTSQAFLEAAAILGGFDRLGSAVFTATAQSGTVSRILFGGKSDFQAVALLEVAARVILRGVIPLTATAVLSASGLVLPAGGPYGPFGAQKFVGHRRFDRYTGRRNSR